MALRSTSCVVLLSFLFGCSSATRASAPEDGGSVIEVVPVRPAQPDPDAATVAPPTVHVDAKQLALGEASVGATSAIGSTKRLAKIDALFDALKRERARSKAAQPVRALDGEYDLWIAPDVPAVVVTSVVMTSAYAGYPTARIETASGVVKIRTPVPRRTEAAKEAEPPKLQLEVHVTDAAWELTTVPISREPTRFGRLDASNASKRTLRKDSRELAAAIERACARAPRCFEALRLTTGNATAPYRELDGVLSAVVAASKPSGTPATSRVTELVVSLREGTGRLGGPSGGRLAPEEIQKVVRSHFDVFRRCYDAGLRKDTNLAGRVGVRFVIGRDGKVGWAGDEADRPPSHLVDVDPDAEELRKLTGESDSDERSTPPPFPDENVRDCVIAGFRQLVFPVPDGGIVTVTYPIIFSPGD